VSNLKFYQVLSLIGLAGLAIFLIMKAPSLCTTGHEEERAPGPLLVWMISDPNSNFKVNLFADKFEDDYGIETKVEFKEDYEITALLRRGHSSLRGRVDVIELDLFDLVEAAPNMEDISPIFEEALSPEAFIAPALTSGQFGTRQLFVPWRLSWPAMVVDNNIDRDDLRIWKTLRSYARENPGKVHIPALRERELFALVCSLVMSYGGDPADPDGVALRNAFVYLQNLAPHINYASLGAEGGDFAKMDPDDRPDIFFDWPGGIIPLITEAAIPLYYSTAPLPCSSARGCAVMPFGYFLGSPADAPHPKDAHQFIAHMTTQGVQSEIIYTSPHLPAVRTGWGDMGIRKDPYQAFRASVKNLRTPPRDLARIEEPLAKVAKMILFEKMLAMDAIDEYREMIGE